MKKLLSLVIILAASSAFATRARINALGNAAHLTDTATIPGNVSDLMALPDSLTIETGKTAAASSTAGTVGDDGAEATLIRSMGDAKVGLILGHDNKRTARYRTEILSGTNVDLQQNPIFLIYGMKMGEMNVAGGLEYSNYNNKTSSIKENTTNLNLAASTQMWAAAVELGLADKWESATQTVKGKTNASVYGSFNISPELFSYAKLEMFGYELTGTTAREITENNMEVGAVHTMKKEGSEFFYGLSLRSESKKNSTTSGTPTETKTTALKLPVIIGVEADAASWLTLRGSITQTVLINDSKEETDATTTSEKSPGDNNTTVAFGTGLKFGKLSLDGTILTGGGQALNFGTGNFMSQVGLTYNF